MKCKRVEILSIALATMIVFSALMVSVPTYAATQAEIDNAIEDGMAWLADEQNPDGSWGTLATDKVGRTGLAVLKFEIHAIENNIDPLHPSYQYYSQVRNGLDYIFNNSYIISIGPQTYGDPDGDNDGIGVYFWPSHRVYNTGIAMMAIAASTHPGKVVSVPTSAVNGWKYRHVLQDALDYMAFAQTDSGTGRGGWQYNERNNASGISDNSNTGYAVLGLGYAQASPPGGFGLTIPHFVKNELDVWIEYIQDASGGSGYTSPGYWVNILKTGNLLYEMWFVGDPASKPRVQAAIDYIVNHWNDTNYSPGWKGPSPYYDPATGTGNVSCYQAMYCVMKALEAFGIEEIDGIDWLEEISDVLVAQQNPNGSWPTAPTFGWTDGSAAWLGADQPISVTWALLTLEKAVPPPPPPTLEDVKEELEAIEEKLDFWLPDIKTEVIAIEEKLDFWLPEIKKEVSDIWTYLTTNITSMLVSIKDEVIAIEEKLDFLIDKETVEIQISRGSFALCKKKYYMLTTIGGQKCNITSITIHAGDKVLDPSDYTVTCLYTGFYKIQIRRKAIGSAKPIVIQVECVQNGVTYYGAALTSAY